MADTPPGYEGKSKAVHVDPGNFSVSPEPEGPPTDVAMMTGKSKPITSHADSPAQWHDETVLGPLFDAASYWGRSQAIHVYGTPAVLTPPPPIHSCRCCAETGCSRVCGTTDIFDRVVAGSPGVASCGTTYTIGQGPLSAWSVDGSKAIVTVPTASRYAALVMHDFQVFKTATVTAQVTSTGGPDAPTDGTALRAQYGPTVDEMVEINVTTDGNLYISTVSGFDFMSLPFTARSLHKLKVGTNGTDGLVKAWLAADPEPISWMLTLPFSVPVPVFDNDVQIGAFTDTGGPVVATLDDLDVPGVNACLRSAFGDDFERTATGGLGSATPDGYLWPNGAGAWNNGGTPAYESVSGGEAVLAPVGSGAGAVVSVDTQGLESATPWPVVTSIRFRVDKTQADLPNGPGPGNSDSSFGAMRVQASIGDSVSFVNGTGYVAFKHVKRTAVRTSQVQITAISTTGTIVVEDIVLGFSFLADTWYEAKARMNPLSVIEYKIWESGLTEPDWTASTTVLHSGWSPVWLATLVGNPVHGFGDPAYFLTERISSIGIEFHACTGTGAAGDCADGGSTCVECEDPGNPGFQLPDFTPGFMPTFRRQIGDPTTNLDSFICTLESAAMVLDWHTRGAVSVWGGELIPYCGKTEAQIAAVGSNLGNARQAWLHWNQYLEIRSGQTFADLMIALGQGRAVVLQGDYGTFTNAVKCQDSFEGNHAISVYPYQIADRLLVGDPLCSTFHGVRIADLQTYAEALTSSSAILFAVSRPWTP